MVYFLEMDMWQPIDITLSLTVAIDCFHKKI